MLIWRTYINSVLMGYICRGSYHLLIFKGNNLEVKSIYYRYTVKLYKNIF